MALIQMMHHEQHEDRVVLFRKDDPGDIMYIILSGRIRIFMEGKDREHTLTLRFYDATQLFGEFAPMDEKPRSASAATVGSPNCWLSAVEDLLTFMKGRPLVGLAMMRNLVERLRYTTDYLRLVTELIQKLSRGEYEQLAAQMQINNTDTEIQKLLDDVYHYAAKCSGTRKRAPQERSALKHQRPINRALLLLGYESSLRRVVPVSADRACRDPRSQEPGTTQWRYPQTGSRREDLRAGDPRLVPSQSPPR